MGDKLLSHPKDKRGTARIPSDRRDLTCCHVGFFEELKKKKNLVIKYIT